VLNTTLKLALFPVLSSQAGLRNRPVLALGVTGEEDIMAVVFVTCRDCELQVECVDYLTENAKIEVSTAEYRAKCRYLSKDATLTTDCPKLLAAISAANHRGTQGKPP